jgi:hypothetical protein
VAPHNVSKNFFKLEKYFSNSILTVLLFTSGTKILSLLYGYSSVAKPDPIINFIGANNLLLIVALIEIGIVFLLVFSKSVLLRLLGIAWISSVFLCYRLCLFWVDYDGGCSCVAGHLSWVTVFDQVLSKLSNEAWNIERLMKFILGYMFIGGYVGLFLHWRQSRKNSRLSVQRQ